MNPLPALLALAGLPLLSTTSAADRKPNLVVILIDDAGYDDFGFTGCKDWKTPNIDRIAKTGVTFTNGYVTASVCGPSRAGLITGRYQQSFGHEENVTGGLAKPVPAEEFGLPLEVPTVATLLKQKNYTTAVFGKWHLGEYDHFHPNNRGFDHFVGFLGGSRSFWPLEKAGKGHQLYINDEKVRTPEYLTDHLGKEAASFIETNKANPFFVYLAYNAVHSPLHATDDDLESLSSIADKKRRVLGAMTIALDRSVGHVLDTLEKHQLTNNTLVVFTNDNGAATYLKTNNGGLRGLKGTVWEGGLRVPFAATWPGHLPAGTKSEIPVSTVDLGTTLCTLAGFSDTELQRLRLSGTDLITSAKGEAEERSLYWKRGNTAAIRHGDWKLIRLKDEPRFLFNITDDPKETRNLLAAKPERAADLAARLNRWDATLPPPRWKKKAAANYDTHLLRYWDQN